MTTQAHSSTPPTADGAPQGAAAPWTPDAIAAAIAAGHRANSGTPPAVTRAFLPDTPSIQGRPLQPLTMATFMALEKIGSPLVRDPQPGEKLEVRILDLARAIILLSVPAPEARRLVLEPKQLEDAAWAFAESLDATQLPALGQVIAAHIKNSFEPAVPTRSSSPGSAKEGAHGSPLASARPEADSAGPSPS